jgi:hypothetical protein
MDTPKSAGLETIRSDSFAMLRTPEASSPRIVFICPDAPAPAGGVRLILRHARILREAGWNTRVVARSRTALARWLDSSEAVYLLNLSALNAGDVLVVPETDAWAMSLAFRKVVLVQSTAFLSSTRPGDTWRKCGVEAVIAVSRHVSDAVRAHQGVEACLIAPSVDRGLFRPRNKTRRIACLSGKNPAALDRVLSTASRAEFDVVRIQGLSHTSVAELLGESALALSVSLAEGFGLFSLEAMASGCVVVGFTAGGGRDFMRDGVNCMIAPDGDEARVVGALEESMERIRRGLAKPLLAAALDTARQFSPAIERRRVLDFWGFFPMEAVDALPERNSWTGR